MSRRSTRTSRSVSAIRRDRRQKNHERAHRRWTRGEEGELTREFHAGKTVEEMALAHKRTVAAIDSRLSKLQLHGAQRTRIVVRDPSAPVPRPRSQESRGDSVMSGRPIALQFATSTSHSLGPVAKGGLFSRVVRRFH